MPCGRLLLAAFEVAFLLTSLGSWICRVSYLAVFLFHSFTDVEKVFRRHRTRLGEYAWLP